MALLEEKQMFGSGMVKEIEESAISLILQNLQQDQYQYPEKSFIREIVSNCVDAIEEKKVAKSILTGESSIEDHYSSVESDITKDSKFDSEYYNLDFLSPEDRIEITYINRYTSNRDKIVIEDTGVGLGGKRLRGFFKPAFSSKRLNKKALGKFGTGSKSGLATGVESYQMISRYNGKEYQFDIYNDRYFSTVPAKNTETFEDNPYEVWRSKRYKEDGTIEEFDNHIHYLLTDLPNGVIISMDVKNPIRNKSKFIDAVKTQLNYFELVRLFEVDENRDGSHSTPREIYFRTEILYRDENLIIPKDNYYAVPHLVLNNVVYCTIDFAEMEMDQKKGNVGIIGDPSEVDVNQSRETVRYTERTRNAIKKYLDNCIGIAQKHIDEELQSSKTDFLQWLISCKNIKAKPSNTNIFSRLSGLADLSKVEFTFEHSSGVFVYNKNSFKDVFKDHTVTKTYVEKRNGVFKTSTTTVSSWEDFSVEGSAVYYRDSTLDRMSAITMGYLADLHKNNCIYLVTKATAMPQEVTPTTESEIDSLEVEVPENVLKSLIVDSVFGGDYSLVEVPQEFIDTYQETQKAAEEAEIKKAVEDSLTEREIRKRDGKILYHTFNTTNPYRIDTGTLIKSKEEISIDEVKDRFNKDNTIFGTSEDIPLLQSILHTSVPPTRVSYKPTKYSIGGSDLNYIVVSKEASKYFKLHATHVKDALQTIEGTKIKLMARLKQYNTARLFKHIADSLDYKFINLFMEIDRLAYDTYLILKDYLNSSGMSHTWRSFVPGKDDIDAYMDNLAKFQLFLVDATDKSEIAKKSKELFNTESLDSCDALDLSMYARYKALEDYINTMKDMFIPYSVVLECRSNTSYFSNTAIAEYIKLKGIPSFSEFYKERCTEFNVEFKDTVDTE